MELHYSKTGNGPALFIVHGLYGSGDNWMNMSRKFNEHFTVYLIDQRNHGQSPHSPSHAYDEMASDLRAICEKENITELFIIGHSMGGKTAITFTLKYPGLVQKIVNVDISPFSYLDQKHFKEQIEYHKLILNTFMTAPISEIKSREEMEKFFAPYVTTKSTRRFLLKNLKRKKSNDFYWQLNIEALSNNLEQIIDAAPPVKFGIQSFIPALFIRGGQSTYISNEEMEAIPDIFPNAKFISFEKSGHWLHAEEPERFITTVLDFLV